MCGWKFLLSFVDIFFSCIVRLFFCLCIVCCVFEYVYCVYDVCECDCCLLCCVILCVCYFCLVVLWCVFDCCVWCCCVVIVICYV